MMKAEVDQDLTAIGKELEKNLYNSEAWAGRDPLIGLNFMIWKSQEFLQAPNMID